MCITAGIQYDPIILKAGFMKFVYQFTFHVGLIISQCYFRVLPDQLINVTLEVLFSVDGFFPDTQKIQIGAVNNYYF